MGERQTGDGPGKACSPGIRRAGKMVYLVAPAAPGEEGFGRSVLKMGLGRSGPEGAVCAGFESGRAAG